MIPVPLMMNSVKAGFPSPAEDFIESQLDLNELLIDHPTATFFVRVDGNSMVNAGIFSGDLLIIDRAKEAIDKKIVVAIVNGEFTVKRLRKFGEKIQLVAENPHYKPIIITPGMDFEIWGVVTHVIHKT